MRAEFYLRTSALSTVFLLCSLASNEIPKSAKVVQPPKPNILKQVSSFSNAPIFTFLFQGCPSDLLHSRALRSIQLACRSHPSTVISAFEGIQEGLANCANRLRFQQWDCSEAGNIMHDPPLLRSGEWLPVAFRNTNSSYRIPRVLSDLGAFFGFGRLGSGNGMRPRLDRRLCMQQSHGSERVRVRRVGQRNMSRMDPVSLQMHAWRPTRNHGQSEAAHKGRRGE